MYVYIHTYLLTYMLTELQNNSVSGSLIYLQQRIRYDNVEERVCKRCMVYS